MRETVGLSAVRTTWRYQAPESRNRATSHANTPARQQRRQQLQQLQLQLRRQRRRRRQPPCVRVWKSKVDYVLESSHSPRPPSILFIIYYILFFIFYLLFIIYYLLFIIIIYYLLFFNIYFYLL